MISLGKVINTKTDRKMLCERKSPDDICGRCKAANETTEHWPKRRIRSINVGKTYQQTAEKMRLNEIKPYYKYKPQSIMENNIIINCTGIEQWVQTKHRGDWRKTIRRTTWYFVLIRHNMLFTLPLSLKWKQFMLSQVCALFHRFLKFLLSVSSCPNLPYWCIIRNVYSMWQSHYAIVFKKPTSRR